MTQPAGATPHPRTSFFQRRWTWWFMIAVLVLVAGVRIRLLNSPLERDEGEYAYAGQLMLQGIPPYQLAYNMKFPGTYAAYALIMALFGQTPAGIHLGTLCVTTLTALMLFGLGKKILDETAGIVAASSYAVLAASPSMLGFAGHATHFAAFFVTAGLWLMWPARQNKNWLIIFASGLLFGLAVLMKQHATLIGAWAGIAFAVNQFRKTETPVRQRLLSVALCAAGMVLPFALCCLILWRAGVFGNFWFWTIDYAREYASLIPVSAACIRFLLASGSAILPALLLWLLAIAGLGAAWFDERLRPAKFWLLGFSVASVLTVFPGFYFREHYFLLVLPAVALSAGCAVAVVVRFWKQDGHSAQFPDLPMLIFALFLAATIFVNRETWFALTPLQTSRAAYGRNPFPEAQIVADYIRVNSAANACVAVIGSEPEIYFLSHRRSATGYIYTYALMESQPFARKMQEQMIREIETNAPEFIIFADNSLSWARTSDSCLKIFDWWDSYQTNYMFIGQSETMPPAKNADGESQKSTRRPGDFQTNALKIYRRK